MRHPVVPSQVQMRDPCYLRCRWDILGATTLGQMRYIPSWVPAGSSITLWNTRVKTQLISDPLANPGRTLGAGSPLPPRCFQINAVFRQLFRKKNYFEEILSSGPPSPWAKNSAAPLTNILDPPLCSNNSHSNRSWFKLNTDQTTQNTRISPGPVFWVLPRGWQRPWWRSTTFRSVLLTRQHCQLKQRGLKLMTCLRSTNRSKCTTLRGHILPSKNRAYLCALHDTRDLPVLVAALTRRKTGSLVPGLVCPQIGTVMCRHLQLTMRAAALAVTTATNGNSSSKVVYMQHSRGQHSKQTKTSFYRLVRDSCLNREKKKKNMGWWKDRRGTRVPLQKPAWCFCFCFFFSSGPVHTVCVRRFEQTCVQAPWCCLQPVWTLPLTIMCSIICLRHVLQHALRPVNRPSAERSIGSEEDIGDAGPLAEKEEEEESVNGALTDSTDLRLHDRPLWWFPVPGRPWAHGWRRHNRKPDIRPATPAPAPSTPATALAYPPENIPIFPNFSRINTHFSWLFSE